MSDISKKYQYVEYGGIDHEIYLLKKIIENPPEGMTERKLQIAKDELEKLICKRAEPLSNLHCEKAEQKSFISAIIEFFSFKLIKEKIEASKELRKLHKPGKRLRENHRFDNFDENKSYA